jgi:phage shock protein C
MANNYKRLYRSRDDRMISGVAAGIAKYLNVDPTLIRLLFVVFALSGGSGLLAYVILAVIIPEEPVEHSTPVQPPSTTEPEGSDTDESM